MAKKALLTIDSTYHKIKKSFITVDSIYHKIKKAYITVGGVWRPFMSAEPEYYGTITPLSEERYSLAATTVGNYALFGGGERSDQYYYYEDEYGLAYQGYTDGSNVVDAYDASLVRTTAPNLDLWRHNLAAITTDGGYGRYALFAGGSSEDYQLEQEGYDPYIDYSTVDVYDIGLTHSLADDLTQARRSTAAVNVGQYTLFCGGTYFQEIYGYMPTSHVDIYDTALTHTTTTLSANLVGAATTVGDYALFIGGNSAYHTNPDTGVVEVFDASLTHTTTTPLGVEVATNNAITVGDYALFRGQSSSTVYIYDNALTQTTTNLNTSALSNGCIATSSGTYAFFGLGSSVDVFDTSLAQTTITETNMSINSGSAATVIGNYALFGGGTTVNAFMI